MSLSGKAGINRNIANDEDDNDDDNETIEYNDDLPIDY